MVHIISITLMACCFLAAVQSEYNYKTRMDFKGKVVIVTGASKGIGLAISLHLAALGAQVVMNGRNVKELRKARELVKSIGDVPDPFLVDGDIGNDKVCHNIIDFTVKKFGQIDVFVNNAGESNRMTIAETPMSDFDQFIKVNLRAPVLLTKLVIPHLKKTSGNIVNISSIAARVVYKTAPLYAVTKAALDYFTKASAAEFAPVRVNSLNVGYIGDTKEYEKYGKEKQSIISGILASTRMGKPADVSAAVAFLASDLASYVSGTTLLIDGGAFVTASWDYTPIPDEPEVNTTTVRPGLRKSLSMTFTAGFERIRKSASNLSLFGASKNKKNGK